MAEGDRLWTIRGGEKVNVPATVAGIRDVLVGDQQRDFLDEVFSANVHTIEQVMQDWIVRIASEPEDEETFAQLRARDQDTE
ncbi:hypothetical protein [Streptomyces albipurpureus]|uniref:Uncharacterized protein n=1 Tax=Streptomyces albipurpureus TaxID=2897419 RepID=A0ABT0UVH5_9ACTN|nr:hypothetical protein [Streptomyces sp. CWNU-1]MCM2392572.1 hypothetical protein [Streptomyces sp. CWNU-1]